MDLWGNFRKRASISISRLDYRIYGHYFNLYSAFWTGWRKKTTNTSFLSLLLFCLSLGGDNLAVYIPLVVNLSWSQIIYVGIIFEICSVLLILLGKQFVLIKPVAYLLEKYGNFGSKIVYVLAGLYIIWNSHLINHLIRIFN